MHKNRTLNVCSPLNAAEYFFKDISCFKQYKSYASDSLHVSNDIGVFFSLLYMINTSLLETEFNFHVHQKFCEKMGHLLKLSCQRL